MEDSVKACTKCGGEMDEGFVLDNTYGGRLQSGWVEGKPKRSFWVGIQLTGREQHPIT